MIRTIAVVAAFYSSAFLLSGQSTPASGSPNLCPALPGANKPPADNPKDTVSLLKAALASEWLNPGSVQNALRALQFLTVGVPRTPVADELLAAKRRLQNLIALDSAHRPVYQKALDDLPKTAPPESAGNSSDPSETAQHALKSLLDGDSDAKHQDLYRFGLGDLQSEGIPDYAGISAFLDYLSQANNLNFSKPDDESLLFTSVKSLLDLIAAESGGRQKLRIVQDSFTSKDNHVALYRLLSAVPADPGSCHYSYPAVLEVFRAAYAMNTDKLAKAVAAINTPSK